MWSTACDGSIISVAPTPNFSVIAASSVAGSGYLLNHNGSVLWRRDLGEESWAAAISEDGSVAAFGTANKKPAGGAVQIFSRQGDALWSYDIGAPVWGVSLSSSGEFLYVGSWDNRVRVFRHRQDEWVPEAEQTFGAAGIYGVAASAGGERALVTVYDEGVLLVDHRLKVLHRFPCADAGYETRISRDGRRGTVGLRGGRVLQMDCSEHTSVCLDPRVTRQAIGGAATTADGRLIVLGCFDGNVYALNREGRVLWRYPSPGEVWSVYISEDGGLLCFGSGDRCVRLVAVLTNCQALAEVEAGEQRILQSAPAPRTKTDFTEAVTCLYQRYGLMEYGASRLLEFAEQLGEDCAQTAAHQLLEADVNAHPAHTGSQFLLAGLEWRRGNFARAGALFVESGREESFRLRAMLNAGDCFQAAGLESAAMSCFRRAREQYINADEMRVLYNLASSYQERGNIAEAITHYAVLLAWDPNYRDVSSRLEDLRRREPHTRAAAMPPDQQGAPPLSLLGPDIPRQDEVDRSLMAVLRARSKELHVSPSQRNRMLEALDSCLASHYLAQSQGDPSLSYDEFTYARYDRLPPEDEGKKALEAVNLFAVIKQMPRLDTSLDIGAATGRHPTAMAGMGVAAFGIDIEERGVVYASRHRGVQRWPQYLVGDGRRLPFRDESFDLVTCMMGTVAHLPAEGQQQLCREAARCLRPNGRLVVSTWDNDCRHLTFLSIYNQEQKELVRRNSLEAEAYAGLFRQAGLEFEQQVPFALLPDVFSYELRVRGMTAESLRRLVEADLAARASFPKMHGQMFLAVAAKPSRGAGPSSTR